MLIWGGAVSYSPLIYRPIDAWPAVRAMLIGEVAQPAAAQTETPEFLARSAVQIQSAFSALRTSLRAARLDSLIVLTTDNGRAFDLANFPQFHVHASETIWGDTSIGAIGESPCVKQLACDTTVADLLLEELFDAGFDMAESHGEFSPQGDPKRGATNALVEPMTALAITQPIIPIHINCHASPMPTGERVHAFGKALADAAAVSPKRIGILASGGLSGEPNGYMAGWIDDTLDRWLLRQLKTRCSAKVTSMFEARSLTLQGNTSQIRLWVAAASAMEALGATGKTIDYFPLHAAATGVGFFSWEPPACP